MKNVILPVSKRLIGLLISSGMVVFSLSAMEASAKSTAKSDKIPSFMMNKNKRMAGRGCPEGMYSRWNILWSPTSGMPYRNPADNPIPGTRPFGWIGINKVFSHTFKTRSLTKPCCRVKQATLWIQSRSSTPNPIIGQDSRNDQYVISEGGAITAGGQTHSANIGLPYNSWGWDPINVSASNVMSDGLFSYALGDDTDVRRTALVARSCCLNPIKRTPRKAAKRGRSKAKQFMNQMNRDKGKTRRTVPTERAKPAQPATMR